MATWGVIPAAGRGSRIQPLAFSKELLPVGSWIDGDVERPRAVSDYLIERMTTGGANRICFVISASKSDILEYYGAGTAGTYFCYVVQPQPAGLCDAIFRPAPLIAARDRVMIGLPDTIWFPEDGYRHLPPDVLAFLLFPVDQPEYFDAVVTDKDEAVREIHVKQAGAVSNWVWGAFQMPGTVYHDLFDLWQERGRADEYVGTLVNAYLAQGGEARAVKAGTSYSDVGTLHGFHEAIQALSARPAARGGPS